MRCNIQSPTSSRGCCRRQKATENWRKSGNLKTKRFDFLLPRVIWQKLRGPQLNSTLTLSKSFQLTSMKPLLLLLVSLCWVSRGSGKITAEKSLNNNKESVKQSNAAGSVEKPARILFVAPFGSKSHKIFYSAIIKAIAKDGHKVTVLTSFSSLSSTENVEEIVYDWADSDQILSKASSEGLLSATLDIMEHGPELCFAALASIKTKEALKKKYDLIFVSMFFNECFLGAVHAMKVPIVFVNPGDQHGLFTGVRMGNPSFPSLNFNPVLGHAAPLTFSQRFMSTFYEMIAEWMITASFDRVDATGHSLGLFPSDTPSTRSLSSNASLMIINQLRYSSQPIPYMPNIALLGGIHCRPARPLKKDLEEWLQGSGSAGFIFFSLGSVDRASLLSDEKVKGILAVLGRVQQRVLWKHDTTQLAVPPNVRLVKRVPQQDVLGHPKIRLFLTEGSQQALQEAAYHGVPVLGLPLQRDLEGNMALVESQGWGKTLSWQELTEETFTQALQEILEDTSRAEAARQRAALVKDVPLGADEEVRWWTRFLQRTKGAPHLRSPAASIKWYELYNVDVWSCIVGCMLLTTWLLLSMLRAVVRRCCCRQKRKTRSPKKRD
ncbi:UDP-glucuronosyl/UDP-glucosyltransferase [Trinorchestia longiramus]|nr:UDP-glucuronosyl/UDP-glucosyltransferase [Trinorchestia longiramus]